MTKPVVLVGLFVLTHFANVSQPEASSKTSRPSSRYRRREGFGDFGVPLAWLLLFFKVVFLLLFFIFFLLKSFFVALLKGLSSMIVF